MVKWEPQKRIMRDRLRNERSRTASFLVSCKVAVAGEARDRESWSVEREARSVRRGAGVMTLDAAPTWISA